MLATQRDVWVRFAGKAHSTVYDVTREVVRPLASLARLVTEVEGWTYKESRDLTGFIDGTENPSLAEAPEVALIPVGAPGAGGSALLAQQWTRDTVAFEALLVAEQATVTGGTKMTSVELDEAARAGRRRTLRGLFSK